MNIKTKLERIALRFVKAFIAGFITSIGLITVENIHVWSDLGNVLNAIALSGVIGGINGVIMAAEKMWNWKDAIEVTPPTPDTPDYIEVK